MWSPARERTTSVRWGSTPGLPPSFSSPLFPSPLSPPPLSPAHPSFSQTEAFSYSISTPLQKSLPSPILVVNGVQLDFKCRPFDMILSSPSTFKKKIGPSHLPSLPLPSQVTKKLHLTLEATKFAGAPVVAVAAKPGGPDAPESEQSIDLHALVEVCAICVHVYVYMCMCTCVCVHVCVCVCACVCVHVYVYVCVHVFKLTWGSKTHNFKHQALQLEPIPRFSMEGCMSDTFCVIRASLAHPLRIALPYQTRMYLFPIEGLPLNVSVTHILLSLLTPSSQPKGHL